MNNYIPNQILHSKIRLFISVELIIELVVLKQKKPFGSERFFCVN